MKHILVPIGSSQNAKNTVQYAIDFAKVMQAKVFLFRAYNIHTKAGAFVNVDKTMQRETNLYLRTIINSVDKKDVEVNMIAAKGDVLSSIVSIDRELGIDLIVMGPRSNSIKEEVFLGSTSGSIVKQTEIPMLVVPEEYVFSPIKKVLTAFKSGVINREDVLNPLKIILSTFKATTNLLLVKTPNYKPKDLVLDAQLASIKNELIVVESPTTFQGVLENIHLQNPDMLCVFRRKRGFFKKLWEKNTILKKEFYCSVPLLILSEKL
ncbi:universal stress protein [Tenacibaculum sp. UWU-22]|uniref:universal stress protein n=1 Tax=Tenacibaculum sp. UWU-22 TaxID=3234187 RepID=UPI0034DB3BD8